MSGSERKLQVGVKAVIENGAGAILLLQRSQPYHNEDVLKWDIPGGRINVEEKQEDALRREIREETGLDLKEIERVFHVQDILWNPKLHVVRITYLVKTTGDVKLSHEHNDYQWVNREDLPLDPTDTFFVDALKANGWIK